MFHLTHTKFILNAIFQYFLFNTLMYRDICLLRLHLLQLKPAFQTCSLSYHILSEFHSKRIRTHAPPGSQTVINSKKPTLAHIFFLFLISLLHTHIMHQAGHARSGGGCRMKIRAKNKAQH
jgi:hypothetical protein